MNRFLAVVLLGLFGFSTAEADPIVLWHSYRGKERQALEQLAASFETARGQKVKLVALPADGFAAKLGAAIPRGHGPDLFIFAHERIGSWVQSGILQPVAKGAGEQAYLPGLTEAVTYRGRQYALPLAFKCLALFYNRKLVERAPQTTAELFRMAQVFKDKPGTYALAYAMDEFYFHAPWFFGFGGTLFSGGDPKLGTEAAAASLRFVQRLVRESVVAPEVNGALAPQMFSRGQAALMISGPWALGELGPSVDYGVALLPKVSATGKAARPFLTVEGVFHAKGGKPGALSFARFLAEGSGAAVRARVARQTVAWAATYQLEDVAQDPILRVFSAQAQNAHVLSARPEMQLIWQPADAALKAALRGETATRALERADMRLRTSMREPPPTAPLPPYMVGLVSLLGLGLALFVWRLSRQRGALAYQVFQKRHAYAYLAPAFAAVLLLVLVPLVLAVAIGFTHHQAGEFRFVGFANFKAILTSSEYGIGDPLSFYFTLLVTMLWTGANVFLHVSIGLALALLLREPWLRMRGLYRALLIIPWAVPNYITALIWKGLFHRQFGAVNELLSMLGLEPVSWFAQFWTAFTANLVTNTWLGFPFMMVVSLGALQAIPRDTYDAADVDGASAWQKFRHVTLPLLRPQLLPAVILGTMWTFNMFNVVYLVSGGEPDGSTDILISEAYRWAFQRREQYGYAAAYATLIFCILIGYTLLTRRIAGGKERRA